ncbi:MAG: cytochrome c [Chthoniobacterales bacterium]|nr:cytochrome c [Chthoniobacterales bacterium]
MKYFFLLFALLVVLVVSMAGFRGQKSSRSPIEIFPDMDQQPKVKAQAASSFFSDGRSNRKPVDGTVPIGYAIPLHKPANDSVGEASGPYKQIYFSSGPVYFDTGKIDGQWGTGMPFEITPELMERGRERFTINCAVCHGATGAGNGIAGKFGLVAIANLHQERLRKLADGEIFNTITQGKNTMMGYGDRIQVQDRWAIIAYIRALQKSQGGATLQEVPEGERAALEAQK